MYWLKSASRVVFVMVAFTVCLGFVMKILPVKEFFELALMAFSFFFGVKQTIPNSVTKSISTTTVDESPTEEPEK